MGQVMDNKPAEHSMEWAVERAEKYAAVTRKLFADGNYVEGTKSISWEKDNYTFTNGEAVETFDEPQQAIDAFMG